ncbi:MAG: peptidoglycan-associated lipoprotein Pal [Acidobacteriia bacterium]|nr:peptidoglycan-associated lipoprotein Pal [Methyloceanibacter sp.]MBX5472390.1 peptidoglycan-associated lipoprotein Pal [Acetobacteraceae bacterium]MCL6490884.1 peptidoglycan-associated lipoprotein Pal [Terriglobia bacterium]
MNIRILAAFAVAALVAACGAQKETAATTTGAGATAAPSGPVPGSEQDFVQNVGDRIYFDFDRSTLRPEAKETLDRQSAWLEKYPQVKVQVAGNCDERGTEEYNLALGQRRADADRDYVVAKGVSAARMTTISYGKDRPVALGSTPEAWAQNRNAITSVQ